MAVSLNSVVSFSSTANNQQIRKTFPRPSVLKVSGVTSLSGADGLRRSEDGKKRQFYLFAATGDSLATQSNNKDSEDLEGSSTATSLSSTNSSEAEGKVQPSDRNGLGNGASDVSNGPPNPANDSLEIATFKSSLSLKRSPLTARERLRAARVLNRYTESKPSKPELGSKLLEALRESDKGKRRPGLPEAPTNLFDDSKRGMPKPGWTFDLPGGVDVLLIVFSFVFISTVMFATTYLVWKVGAIHFNEY